ncbi:hypothetical protein RIF29_19786 [Crotalaria pallida]|uniref:Uncharacterized protein n=1 Tax=Crotalaria pallida TaxID=3830 RepID=A0AAN9F016_CROPI
MASQPSACASYFGSQTSQAKPRQAAKHSTGVSERASDSDPKQPPHAPTTRVKSTTVLFCSRERYGSWKKKGMNE